MLSSMPGHRAAIRACVADLHENGIDLSHARHREFQAFVRQHLDYFQLMIGSECRPNEIVTLLEAEAGHAGGPPMPVGNPSHN